MLKIVFHNTLIMPGKIPILVILLSLACPLRAQEKYTLYGDYRDLSFVDFVTTVESIYPVKFFYKQEWVGELKISHVAESTSLSRMLDELFAGTALYYFMEQSGNIIITKNFAVKDSNTPADHNLFVAQDNTGNTVSPGTAKGSVEIGNPNDRNKSGNVLLTGYITTADTKEPVPGVTLFVQKLSTGTISNEFGYYSLSLPRGQHMLQFSSIGMKEKVIHVNLFGPGEMPVEMSASITPLKEVVVTAEKSMTLQRFEVGVEKININSFKLLPTSLGESDILQSVLLIPGVQSVGEGAAGFNVRGGSADQNLILLNGSPVYNSSHLFGFFSAINADIIKDVTLYKGGIPSRFGGRISSVLDITTKDGSRNKFGGSAGVSPITTHLMVEGPIIKDALTYLIAARTTYSNWIFGLVQNESIQNSRAFFYDFNGKLTYDLNKNNKLDFSAYVSHDSFRFNSDTVYAYDNSIYSLKWRHFFNSRFFSMMSINNSSYHYDISSTRIPSEAFVHSHRINSTGFKADFNWFPESHEVNLGVDLTRYAVSPGQYFPAHDSSLVIPRTIEKEQAWEGAFYIDDKFTLSNFLSFQVGMRFSTFYALGPQTVMAYDPRFSKSESTITDTLYFKTGSIMEKYAGPEFRVALNLRITGKTSLKINYNRTRQYLHLLSNSTSISPTDSWKLSDYHIKPQIGDQVGAGFYRVMFNSSFELSAEIYYKRIRNMVDFKGGTNLIMNDDIEKDMVDVQGRAYGLELGLKKTNGKLRYSIGYTYSRTLIKSTGSFSEEVINGGDWFPANVDKPNDLVISLNYLVSRRFSLSTNYLWSTGRPITFPVATYIMYDNELVHYSDRNMYRIPDYSRLDLSFKIYGNLKTRKIAHPCWTFSVYNLLGRENVYSVYFKKEGELMKGYKLSVFGSAIPTITFSFDF